MLKIKKKTNVGPDARTHARTQESRRGRVERRPLNMANLSHLPAVGRRCRWRWQSPWLLPSKKLRTKRRRRRRASSSSTTSQAQSTADRRRRRRTKAEGGGGGRKLNYSNSSKRIAQTCFFPSLLPLYSFYALLRSFVRVYLSVLYKVVVVRRSKEGAF